MHVVVAGAAADLDALSFCDDLPPAPCSMHTAQRFVAYAVRATCLRLHSLQPPGRQGAATHASPRSHRIRRQHGPPRGTRQVLPCQNAVPAVPRCCSIVRCSTAMAQGRQQSRPVWRRCRWSAQMYRSRRQVRPSTHCAPRPAPPGWALGPPAPRRRHSSASLNCQAASMMNCIVHDAQPLHSR